MVGDFLNREICVCTVSANNSTRVVRMLTVGGRGEGLAALGADCALGGEGDAVVGGGGAGQHGLQGRGAPEEDLRRRI